jgi:imidazolonepropionase-like amidohydrolase
MKILLRMGPIWGSRGGILRGIGVVALAASLPLEPRPLAAQTIGIQADRVMTSTTEGIVGPRFIMVEEGRIASVTEQRPADFPRSAQVLDAVFVAPGLIDARTTLGLSGLHPSDDDRDETSGPNQAHLRAIDAFDLNDPMVARALRNGVTTVQTGPGDANSIGGQTGIFKLSAVTVDDATVRFPSAVAFSLDESAKTTYGSENRFPSTRMANVGLIRQALLDAGRYRAQVAGEDPPNRDLKKEALSLVLSGEVPALVSAERADELITALRLREEFGFDLKIVGATDAPAVLDRLGESGIAIFLGPARDAYVEPEAGSRTVGTVAMLQQRGIPFALVTGDNRNATRLSLLDLARAAVRGGLTLEQALEAVTIAPAFILGLDEVLGSIEPGKQADLVLFDGDPMNASTRVSAVIAGGKVVSTRGP